MSDTIPTSSLITMLQAAGAKIHENVDLLTQLDSVTGDGDHGTAMQRSIEAVEKAIEEHSEAGAKETVSKSRNHAGKSWSARSAAAPCASNQGTPERATSLTRR